MVVTIAPQRDWTRYSIASSGGELVVSRHQAGDAVEVTDDEAVFLLETGVIELETETPKEKKNGTKHN